MAIADLKTDNLMLSLEDITMLADFAKAEEENPSARKKINDSRTIYKSRRFRPPVGGKGFGLPVLCDFGEARIGMAQQTGPFVQPHIYRAPEVIFEMSWGSAVDIWNLAGLVSASSSAHKSWPRELICGRSGISLRGSIYLEIFLTKRVATTRSNTWR